MTKAAIGLKSAALTVLSVAAIGALILVARPAQHGPSTVLVNGVSQTTSCPVESAHPSSSYALNDNSAFCVTGVPQAVLDRLPALSQPSSSSVALSDNDAQGVAVKALAKASFRNSSGVLSAPQRLSLVGSFLADANGVSSLSSSEQASGLQPYWVLVYYSSSPYSPGSCGLSPDCSPGHYFVALVNANDGSPALAGLEAGS